MLGKSGPQILLGLIQQQIKIHCWLVKPDIPVILLKVDSRLSKCLSKVLVPGICCHDLALDS